MAAVQSNHVCTKSYKSRPRTFAFSCRGSVCGDKYFDDVAASVVCRQLGLSRAGRPIKFWNSKYNGESYTTEGAFWI